MMTSLSEDAWIATLSGRAEPVDATTRQAAQARALIEAELRSDLEAERDAARQARWLAALSSEAARARAAVEALGDPGPRRADERGVHTPGDGGDSPGALARLIRWLLGVGAVRPGEGGRARYALAMLMVVGLSALLIQQQPWLNDEALPKTSPNASGRFAVTQAIDSARPLEDAIRLRDALRERGLSPIVIELGDATRVEAEVTSERTTEVEQLLRSMGIEWSSVGQRLSMEFRRRP